MVTYPNQKVVTINKQPCDEYNLYAKINIEVLESAAQVLTQGGFKLFMYFAKNQDNYKFALSSKDVQERWGMSKTAYDNAIKDLIKNEYLVQENKNEYSFIEFL